MPLQPLHIKPLGKVILAGYSELHISSLLGEVDGARHTPNNLRLLLFEAIIIAKIGERGLSPDFELASSRTFHRPSPCMRHAFCSINESKSTASLRLTSLIYE
jgi:hypothetical protein